MGTLTAASARLDRALDASRAADVDLATAALHLMCLQIREAHPTAETAILDWSDQGDWLLVVEVHDGSGDSAEWDDPDCLAANLEGHTEGVWLPFMTPPANGAIRNPTDLFRLPIVKTIRHFTPEENR
ncbi:hypothetical protein [Nocardioides sp.]|uniref:hypothetical protein n=1 Tax=Nocardioides sp. TaxID=35761 RepID=UPI0027325456|nr:hypothetical protein [Nocardioides sp.]MDP3889854.1 hypothetical protein [Nocardioides sp.]